MSGQMSSRAVKAENQLLRKLCRLVKHIEFGAYRVELLDVHLHLPQFESSITHHCHSHTEIHTVVSGAGRIKAGRKSLAFAAGQFTVTRPDEFHFWEVAAAPLLMHVWWLRFPQPGAQTGEVAELFGHLRRAPGVVYDLPEGFEEGFGQMLAELKKHRLGYDWIVYSQLQQLLIALARATVKRKRLKSGVNAQEDQEDRVIRVVNRFLEDNLATHVSLEDIAKFVSMSKRSLTRHYKRVAGVTIGERLQTLRMQAAMRLLGDAELPVKAVAMKCGMPDVSYFSKQFKRTFGCAPSEFRSSQG